MERNFPKIKIKSTYCKFARKYLIVILNSTIVIPSRTYKGVSMFTLVKFQDAKKNFKITLTICDCLNSMICLSQSFWIQPVEFDCFVSFNVIILHINKKLDSKILLQSCFDQNWSQQHKNKANNCNLLFPFLIYNEISWLLKFETQNYKS